MAVLFYEEKRRESLKALQRLEMIDDEADLFGIRLIFNKNKTLGIFNGKNFFLSSSSFLHINFVPGGFE